MAGSVFSGGSLPHEVSTAQPGGAWVMRADGQRLELMLTEGDAPGEWVASPPEEVGTVMVQRGDRLGVSLHQGQSVRFERVWSEAGEPLVVQEDHP